MPHVCMYGLHDADHVLLMLYAGLNLYDTALCTTPDNMITANMHLLTAVVILPYLVQTTAAVILL